MEASILTSTKKLLGIEKDYNHFDTDLIIHINSVLSILTQLGVGPEDGFSIEDDKAVWSDFIPGKSAQEFAKTYVYLKVKLIFDPPLTASVIDSIKQLTSELEWRIQVAADQVNTKS